MFLRSSKQKMIVKENAKVKLSQFLNVTWEKSPGTPLPVKDRYHTALENNTYQFARSFVKHDEQVQEDFTNCTAILQSQINRQPF